MANVVLEPVDLSLPIMKELGAKWLTDMTGYLASNSQFIVNGFIRSGVSHALDHSSENIPESPLTCDDDDEDSDYQADSDDENDLNDTDSDKGGNDNEEEDPDNDEKEYLSNVNVGYPDDIIVLDFKTKHCINAIFIAKLHYVLIILYTHTLYFNLSFSLYIKIITSLISFLSPLNNKTHGIMVSQAHLR